MLGFSVALVRELAAEDISEFQVMFLISTDSFDGPSRRFLRHIARLDGSSIQKALYDNANYFSGQFAPTVPATRDLS